MYRSDTHYIRVTFADDDDRYVVKGTYGTSADGVLTNSKYADKSKLIDLKIMFRPEGSDKYRYLHVMNMVPHEAVQNGVVQRVVLDTNLDDETCKYCHRIAEYSGSASGLFFRRYQYKSQAMPLKINGMFDSESFVLSKSKPNWIPAGMRDEDVYISVDSAIPVIPVVKIKSLENQRPDFNKIRHNRNFILETPQLLEVLARDNKKSYCAGFTGMFGPPGFVSYVCADNKHKKLYVNYYSQSGDLINRVEPFYKDTREKGMVRY